MDSKNKKCIILGGGPLSLSICHEKLKQGYNVTIIEKSDRLLGLAQTFSDFGTEIECFYHFFYKNDHFNSAQWVRDVTDREPIIEWKEIETTTYANGKIVNFDSIFDIMRLSGSAFFKVFTTLISLKLFTPSKKLDEASALLWSEKAFGKQFAKSIWHPLILQKFGDQASDVSALWLATRIKRHLSTKSLKSGKSVFGYLVDTYTPAVSALSDRIQQSGGEIRLNTEITKLTFKKNLLEKISTNSGDIKTNDIEVYSGIPLSALKDLVTDVRIKQDLSVFRSVSVVVAVLKLKQRISNSYWTTVSDDNIPFSAILQQNRLYEKTTDEVVYLSQYCANNDPLMSQSIDDIQSSWISNLLFMFPHLSPEDVIQCRVFRARNAAPIPCIKTGKYVATKYNNFDNFSYCGYEEIYPEDRGVGNSIAIGMKLADGTYE